MNKKTAALFSAAFLAAATLPAAAIAMPSICVKPDSDVAARFDGVGCYDNVVMLIQKNGLYGYAELDGKIIIPPQYQDAADKPAERFPNTARRPECGKTAVIFQSTSKAVKSNSKTDNRNTNRAGYFPALFAYPATGGLNRF